MEKRKATPSRDRVAVTVLVTGDASKNIGTVAQRCERAGLRDIQVLEFAGTISGTISPKHKGKLMAVPGVSEIEDESSYSALNPEVPSH